MTEARILGFIATVMALIILAIFLALAVFIWKQVLAS